MKSEVRPANSLPIQLNLQGRKVLVAGGGVGATRLIFRLLLCGARITVVCSKADQELRMLAADKEIRWIKAPLQISHFNGADLIFSASGSRLKDARVARLARRKKVWVGTCRPDRKGDLHLADFFRRGGLICSLSGAEELPWLSRYLIRRMQRAFGPEWAALVAELRKWKNQATQKAQEQKVLMRGIPRWLRHAKQNRIGRVRKELQRLMR